MAIRANVANTLRLLGLREQLNRQPTYLRIYSTEEMILGEAGPIHFLLNEQGQLTTQDTFNLVIERTGQFSHAQLESSDFTSEVSLIHGQPALTPGITFFISACNIDLLGLPAHSQAESFLRGLQIDNVLMDQIDDIVAGAIFTRSLYLLTPAGRIARLSFRKEVLVEMTTGMEYLKGATIESLSCDHVVPNTRNHTLCIKTNLGYFSLNAGTLPGIPVPTRQIHNLIGSSAFMFQAKPYYGEIKASWIHFLPENVCEVNPIDPLSQRK